MIYAFFTYGNHRVSDSMHELGHVLWNANEHALPLNGMNYNCVSIMGHSAAENAAQGSFCGSGTGSDVITAVQSHDVIDFNKAYTVLDAPNATFATLFGAGTLVHWFEGGYLGGNGLTLHQEETNRLTRSTSGIGGSYSVYQNGPRKVDNEDDANPENDAYADVPGIGAEWCLKRAGLAVSVTGGTGYQTGPAAKIYCVAHSGPGSGVFVASDRNGNANFRVWNFTGATLLNVQLRTDPPPGTQICNFGNIANNAASFTCPSSISGPGYLTLWYNNGWVAQDTIGYDQ